MCDCRVSVQNEAYSYPQLFFCFEPPRLSAVDVLSADGTGSMSLVLKREVARVRSALVM